MDKPTLYKANLISRKTEDLKDIRTQFHKGFRGDLYISFGDNSEFAPTVILREQVAKDVGAAITRVISEHIDALEKEFEEL